ncbi:MULTISPECIES: hypothetical protein [Citrobacter]|uniref:hypothetical protein n=1 Tax=Citrobacter TaxID=544 RepID=UPI001BCEE61E|nr:MULTISPECIES: hypothetical protein [Citrobacter]MDM3176063.1 hypothetical protein [Citrobacter sp. Cf112]MDT7065101.1 hypothetical protein [Citrobacter freundii]MDT7080157.1 hypothetical protein [Citrobacter freundii]MDT7105064.1 hypothetical protein [Citrobacter freundii]MDT7111915.1 hypothetical protein [Citrobacter freundii]
MSDKKVVRFDDFVEFLEGFDSQSNVCPFCKTSKWTLSAVTEEIVNKSPTNLASLIPAATIGGLPSALTVGGLSVLLMVCNECGFTHIFDHDKVLNRLERMRAQAKEASVTEHSNEN